MINLLFAAYNGDVSALRQYFLQGTDMSSSDYDARTALHLAAAEGEFNTDFRLYSRKYLSTTHFFAAYNGDVSALRQYFSQGTDISSSDYDARTALHLRVS